MTTDGSIEWWNLNDYVYTLLVPEIVNNNNLTEANVKRLLSALDNDADRDHINTANAIIRMKELVFLRSMYNIETNVYASDPLSSLSSTVDKAQRANMGYLAIPLSTITPDQIQSNRDAFNREAESISNFFESGDYERITSVDAYLEQRNQIEAGQMEAFKAAMKNDADMFKRMNTLPWLSMMMRPVPKQLVGLSTWAIARRRVAIATLAVRIASLQNAQDSEALPSLFRRLNIKASPIDPYSGQPLKTIQKDGKTLVYSIGSDRIDDQTVTKAESYHLPGDLFFVKRTSQ
ncbi:hypothetical protein [Roseimaritima multifibrata]|nr:hypothetical protein [Roseimaritima multifibrata]